MRTTLFESIRENQAGLKLESLAAAASVLLVSMALASPALAAAEGVTVNRGACMSELAQTKSGLVPEQAPGQTGNGPLTIVNGNVIVPAAFEGAVGCSH